MEYRALGQTEIKVSVIGLGTMTWGEQNSEDEAHAQMDFALEQGINFFDAAEMYPVPPRAETQGLTETYIGRWLRSRGVRERIVLATKVAGPNREMNWIRGGPELVREHLERGLADSLARLQTDYVDLYQVHWPARPTNYFGRLGYQAVPGEFTAIAETAAVLAEFVAEGRVRSIGISNETPWGFMEWLRACERGIAPRIVSIQNPYNLLNRSFEVGLAEMALREQVGLLAYSPLAFGVLSGKYLQGQRPAGARVTLFERFSRYSGEHALAAVTEYVALAREHGLTPVQLALAFVNQQPFVTSNLVGATRLEQLRENVATWDLKLDADVQARIESIHQRFTYPCP
jgi:aryl-alcohol dehydrogenase-like predicted oxidoreductase